MLSLLAPLLLAFTVVSSPARHPDVGSLSAGVAAPYLWAMDPYAPGATAGIPNVTAKPITCTSTQAIGFQDTGSAMNLVCIDAATASGTSGTPAAPGAGQITNYGFEIDAGWPIIPASIDSFMAIPMPTGTIGTFFTNFSTQMSWTTGCVYATTWGSTTVTPFNQNTPVTTGTLSSVAWSSGSFLGRQRSINLATAGTANNSSGVKNTNGQQNGWRGNTASAGGFLWWGRGGLVDTNTNTRHAHGLFARNSVLIANADPNAELDTVYFGCNQGDTNFSICSNDGSGTATCNTLGASFPCTTDGAYYDFWLTAAPNGGVINYYIERLDTPAQVSGSITSDLPTNTVQMNWHMWLNNGSNNEAHDLRFLGTCIAVNL